MSLQLLGDDRLGKLNDEQKQLVGSIRDSSDRLLYADGRIAEHDADRDRQARNSMPKITKPIELIDYAVKADAGIGRAVSPFRRGGGPRKKNPRNCSSTAKRSRGSSPTSRRRTPSTTRPKNRASSWAPYSTTRRSKSTCGISDGASTRVTTRAFSNAISAIPGTKVQGSGLGGWPSPRSSSRRTAALIGVESEIGKGSRFSI